MGRRDTVNVLVWIALLVLLAATAASALLPLGVWNSVLNLAIAALKTVLVMLFFMRLRSSHILIRLTAVTGLATLSILFVLSASDYLTRERYAAPYQRPRQIAPCCAVSDAASAATGGQTRLTAARPGRAAEPATAGQ